MNEDKKKVLEHRIKSMQSDLDLKLIMLDAKRGSVKALELDCELDRIMLYALQTNLSWEPTNE